MELDAAGCLKIFREKASGAKTDRPELAKLLRGLDAGDVLIVTRLDRLARSTRDLLNVLDAIAKQGAGFRSLKDAWADTTTPHGRLMLTVLGGLAEFERELIRERTGEGRRRAKDRGVRFGRPPKLTVHQRKEALARLAAGETQADVARTYAGEPHDDWKTSGRLVERQPANTQNRKRMTRRHGDRQYTKSSASRASLPAMAAAPSERPAPMPRPLVGPSLPLLHGVLGARSSRAW
jgi:DNA invertase Pin-like site-specific DNA recombinase